MKQYKRITVDRIMSWGPCEEYPRERVEELWSGKTYLTPRQIADLDIPAIDRLWALLRPEILPENILHELACRFAETALDEREKRGFTVDPRSRDAIDVKRRWIAGEATDDELDAAWAAAWDAARDAAWAAAWAAVRFAARDAAWAAAWAAARDAVRFAARAAAWAAACDAAWGAQFEMVREFL